MVEQINLTDMKYILLIILATLLLFGCKKTEVSSPNSLPPPWNVMKAQIDGVSWAGRECYGDLEMLYAHGSAHLYSEIIQIEGTDYCNESETNLYSVSISVTNFTGVGTYLLGGTSGNAGRVQFYSPTFKTIHHSTDTNHLGEFIITEFDTMPRQFSGTYRFTAFNSDSSTVLSITEGVIINVVY